MGTLHLTDDDWALLQPVEMVQLGRSAVNILPFSLDDMRQAAMLLWGLTGEFTDRGITLENFTERLEEVTEIVTDHSPEIIALAMALRPSEIKALPAAKQLEILLKIWDVNKKAQQGLEKNLPRLLKELPGIIAGASAMLSSFSLQTGTDGQTSGSTISAK